MQRDFITAVEDDDRAECERRREDRRTDTVAESAQIIRMPNREQDDEQTAGDREPRYDGVALEEGEKIRLWRVRVQRHRGEQRYHECSQPDPSGGVARPAFPHRRNCAGYSSNRDEQ